MMRLWAAALAILLPSSLAASQPPDSTPGGHWTANGELSFTDIAGNKSLSLLTTGLGTKLENDSHYEMALSGSAQYGRSDGDVAVASVNGEFNLRLRPTRRISPFVRTTAAHDAIRNLNVRMSMAAGAEFNLITEGPSTVTVGLAMLQDYESRALPEGSTDPASVSSTRFNLQFRGSTPLRPGVLVSHTSQLEPVAGDLDDYLLSSKTSLKVALTDALAFQTSYTFNRDATPPPGVTYHNDRTLTTGLVVTLK
jgi:hypothetical protein